MKHIWIHRLNHTTVDKFYHWDGVTVVRCGQTHFKAWLPGGGRVEVKRRNPGAGKAAVVEAVIDELASALAEKARQSA